MVTTSPVRPMPALTQGPSLRVQSLRSAPRPIACPPRRRPNRPSPCQRALHLVDIENLAGAPDSWTPANLRGTFADYLSASEWHPADALIVAANPLVMIHLAFELEGLAHRSLCGTGPDAADNLLLHAVPNDLVARYDRLSVGSGDHAFAPLVASLQDRIPTLVVRSAGRLAAKLYVAADRVVDL